MSDQCETSCVRHARVQASQIHCVQLEQRLVEKSDSECEHKEKKKREKANETKSREFLHFSTTKFFMSDDFAYVHMQSHQSYTTNDVQHSQAFVRGVWLNKAAPVLTRRSSLGSGRSHKKERWLRSGAEKSEKSVCVCSRV